MVLSQSSAVPAAAAAAAGDDLHRLALEAGRVCWFHWNVAADRVLRSSSAPRVFGLPVEGDGSEFIGRLHADDRPGVERAIAALTPDAPALEIDFRLRCPEAARWLLVRAKARGVFDGRGALTALRGVMTEVSDRQLVEAQRVDTGAFAGALLEAAPDLVWVVDAADAVLFVNRCWRQYTGRALEQLKPAGLCELHHPDERAALAARWRQAVAAGTAYEGEFRLRRHDGEYRWFWGRAVPLPAVAGRHRQWVGIATDITERRQMEAALVDSEARFRTMADGLPLIVWVHDAQGRQQFVNRTYREFFGVTQQQIDGGVWTALLHPDDADAYLAEFQRCLHSHEPFHAQVRVRAGDGAWHWIESWGRPQFKGGVLVGLVGSSADVTARRAVEESRERLLQLVEHSEDFIATSDPDGRLTYLNPAGRRMIGLAADADAGTLHYADYLPPQWTQFFDDTVLPAVRESGLWQGQMQLRHLTSGALIDVQRSTFLIRDPASGAPWCYATLTRDIGAHKRALEALAASEERFRALVHQATAGIAQADLDGRVMLVNDRFCEITGYPRAALLQRRMRDITHPDDLPGNEALFRAMVRKGTPFELEKRYLRPDGSVVWVSVAVSPVRDRDGRTTSALAVVQDIGTRKAAEQALRDDDRRKNEFIALLAHELRNPLAPLRNAGAILRHQALADPSLRWCSDVIERQIEQMARLLDDLLDVGRITHGKLELRLAPVALADVVAKAVEIARPEIDAGSHALQLELPAAALIVRGDAVRLAQVVCNLLNNAAKYSAPGTPITLRLARDGDVAVLGVRDHGVGIAPEHLQRIFEMFAQVDVTRGRSRGGLGIGLALVRALVGLHGGSIEAHSDGLDRGSEFVLRLPLQLAPPAADAGVSCVGPAAGAAPRRVLVADDLHDTADSLGLLLEGAGHEVQVVYDGGAALAAAASFQPQVVVLDIGMPQLNGYQVARAIRQQPWGRDMLLVAVTGWGQLDDQRAAAAAGFDRHLTKPMAFQALLDAVEGRN